MNVHATKRILACFSVFVGLFLLSSQSISSELSIHKVVRNCENCSAKLFYEGKDLYENYKLMGLDEDFVIEKQAGVKFRKDEIESVKIEKVSFVPNEPASYTVVFNFSKEGAGKLKEYTDDNKGKLISVQIDETVIQLATIIEPLTDELAIALTEISPVLLDKLEVIAGKKLELE